MKKRTGRWKLPKRGAKEAQAGVPVEKGGGREADQEVTKEDVPGAKARVEAEKQAGAEIEVIPAEEKEFVAKNSSESTMSSAVCFLR